MTGGTSRSKLMPTTWNGRTLPLLFAAPPPPPISCEDLGKLDFPVSFVVGQDTRAFYKVVSKAASPCLPGPKFIEVPNARHLWPVQNPAAFSQSVLDFLNYRCVDASYRG